MNTIAPSHSRASVRWPSKIRAAVLFALALGCLIFATSCKSTSAADLHDVLHDARLMAEPIVAELVTIENDPELTARFQRAQKAADAVHLAFEAYVVKQSESNATALHAALAAATAVADELLASIPGDDPKAVKTRLYIRLALGLVEVTARHIGPQPAPAPATP